METENQTNTSQNSSPESSRVTSSGSNHNHQQRPNRNSSTGLEENIGGLLCYVGAFITGIIFLVIEKENRFIRFHALQSVFVWIIYFAVQMFFSWIPFIGWLFNVLLTPIGLLIWLFLMYKAFKGEWYKFPFIGELVEQQIK